MIKWTKRSLIDIPFTQNTFLSLKTRDTCQWNKLADPQNLETMRENNSKTHPSSSVYIEKQWKSRTMEFKNVFCVNRT